MASNKQHKLFWGSSFDRGLQYLLFMWPEIRLKFPDAELHICYGWATFLQLNGNNPERMEWYKSMVTLMKQPGITDHGRLGKEELAEVRKSCGIWAYPTDFQEINCITALDAQHDGLVPVTMSLAALQETVGTGIKVDGDIKEPEIQKKYLEELLEMMWNEEKWEKESKKAVKFAKGYDWDHISQKWVEIFNKPVKQPKVSIITPTIREGFFRIMSENIASQTYKNIEWLIIDDYATDRRAIAEKYAKEYKLDIRYFRGEKVTKFYNRRCGLVAANNIGWKNAKGELLVWLQDFILMPESGIEQLVTVYNHNPDAMIAPVDIYYDCTPAKTENKEDWWPDVANDWDGDRNQKVLAKETWRNVRVKNQGIRESENPTEWEANYGAVPKHILDKLNGWWTFMDDGLGYDNLEMAYRAMKLGYRLIIDDTNIAKCINLWPIIGGTPQNIVKRDRALNPPRWVWLSRRTEEGKLPIVRDEKLDQSISLPFEVPAEVKDEDCANWITVHTLEIVKGWEDAHIL
jgi:glycosyltransferase involved in cell wall biosynthesis